MSDAPAVEVHIERLLGRRVRDARGVVVGRIEEVCVEIVNGEPVVAEFHVGSAALLERVAGFVHQLPFFSLIPRLPRLRKIRWEEIDLRDASHPRLRDTPAR